MSWTDVVRTGPRELRRLFRSAALGARRRPDHRSPRARHGLAATRRGSARDRGGRRSCWLAPSFDGFWRFTSRRNVARASPGGADDIGLPLAASAAARDRAAGVLDPGARGRRSSARARAAGGRCRPSSPSRWSGSAGSRTSYAPSKPVGPTGASTRRSPSSSPTLSPASGVLYVPAGRSRGFHTRAVVRGRARRAARSRGDARARCAAARRLARPRDEERVSAVRAPSSGRSGATGWRERCRNLARVAAEVVATARRTGAGRSSRPPGSLGRASNPEWALARGGVSETGTSRPRSPGRLQAVRCRRTVRSSPPPKRTYGRTSRAAYWFSGRLGEVERKRGHGCIGRELLVEKPCHLIVVVEPPFNLPARHREDRALTGEARAAAHRRASRRCGRSSEPSSSQPSRRGPRRATACPRRAPRSRRRS